MTFTEEEKSPKHQKDTPVVYLMYDSAGEVDRSIQSIKYSVFCEGTGSLISPGWKAGKQIISAEDTMNHATLHIVHVSSCIGMIIVV